MNAPTWPDISPPVGGLIVCWFILCWLFLTREAKGNDIVYPSYMAPVNVEWEVLSITGAENWDPVKRPVGDAGERGPMQFTEERWKELSIKPFRWADSRQNFAIRERKRVEVSHILDLIQKCQKLNRRATPYLVALIHAAGYDKVASNSVPAMKKDFASRAANIYHELEKAR